MVQDCIDKVLGCKVYHKFFKKETHSTTFYTPVTIAIPFAKWGMDIPGPSLRYSVGSNFASW